MPRMSLVTLSIALLSGAAGCEEVVVPDSAAQESTDSGPKSALGKANQRGVDLSRQIGAYQDDLSQQADSIFQDQRNPRRESEDAPGSSSSD